MDRIVQGASLVIPKQRMSADGVTPASTYLPTDVLTCRVWTGADHSAIATPLVAWNDATIGTFSIAFAPADTATLDPDLYSMQVVCTRAGIPAVIVNERIEVTAAPGSARRARRLHHLPGHAGGDAGHRQSAGRGDETGFAAERADARNWLDEAVHRHNDGTANLQSDLGALAYAYRWPGKSPTMISWLASNYLVMSQPLVKAQVYYTLSQVFAGRQLSNPKLYSEMARIYEVKASNTLRLATAQVMSGGSSRWYAGGGCYDGTLLTILDFSATIRLRG